MEYHFQLVHQIRENFGQDAILSVDKGVGNPNECVIVTRPKDLLNIAGHLKNQRNFKFLLDVCGVHYPDREQTLEAVYQFHNREQNQRVRLKVPHKEGEKIPSLTPLYKTANWFEREAYDMIGIQFEGHPNLIRILCHHEFVGHPLRKDYPSNKNQVLDKPSVVSFPPLSKESEDEEDVLTNQRTLVNIGPSHPATHGAFRVFAELEGEIIKRAKVEIGYLHRCFEKMAETHKYQQVIPYTDRLNYLSAPMNNAGYCRAVEKLLGIEIPPRAQYIRVILSELSRVIDHLVCIGATAVDLGALTVFWFCFRQRENVYELFESLCGNRMLTSITRIGGVFGDLDEEWKQRCRNVIKTLRETVEEVDRLLTNNKIWLNRMKGTGYVSQENAISYGYTGPCLRAAGVDHDLRKADPYYDYDNFEFDVPVYKEGDNFARYLVRMEEMRQSLRIVEQALTKIPDGPTQISDPKIVLPPKSEVYTNIEALMNHFMLIIHGIQPPKKEVYSYTEVANGELGFYIVSDGTGKPYRVKVRPPCFAIFSSYEEAIEGSMLADAIATLGQFNVIAGELDR
jgi:NADH-quinone oxidoreductase subunit C/D